MLGIPDVGAEFAQADRMAWEAGEVPDEFDWDAKEDETETEEGKQK